MQELFFSLKGNDVTWLAVDGAICYEIYDDNDYRENVIIDAQEGCESYTYRTEVVGKHFVTVKAFGVAGLIAEGGIQANENYLYFCYQCISEGKYHFRKENLPLGLDETKVAKCGPMYEVYYNREKGWVTDKAQATDYTSEEELDELLLNLKAMGINVLYPESVRFEDDREVFENSKLKQVMDKAWKYGLKLIVDDLLLVELSTDENLTEEEIFKIVQAHYDVSGGAREYLFHKAFYGVMIRDEPVMSRLPVECAEYRAISRIFEKNGINGFIHTDLLPFEVPIFEKEENYKKYLETWIKETRSDFFSYDLYSSYVYKGRSAYCYSTTLRLVGEFLKKDTRLKAHQTLTAFGYNLPLTEADVCLSVGSALALNLVGTSYFCTFPCHDAIEFYDTIFDLNGNKTPTYAYVKKAIENYAEVKPLLEGYILEDIKDCLGEDNLNGNAIYTVLRKNDRRVRAFINNNDTRIGQAQNYKISGGSVYILADASTDYRVKRFWTMEEMLLSVEPGGFVMEFL